jgi:hypothetical protein
MGQNTLHCAYCISFVQYCASRLTPTHRNNLPGTGKHLLIPQPYHLCNWKSAIRNAFLSA